MRKRFDSVSLAVGALGVLLILASLLVTIYRFGLPWEGWSYTRDLTGAGQRLVFNENIAAASIGIRHDDLLLTVEGRPVEELLADAVSLRPKRAPRWEAGSLVVYTVSRTQFGGEHELEIIVPLVRLLPGQVLLAIVEGLFINLTVLPPFLIALFVFVQRPKDIPARLFYLLTACYLSTEGISHGVTHSNVVGPAELYDSGAFWGAQFFNSLIWPFLIAPLYVNLFWRFPITKRPLREHHRLTSLLLYGLVPAATFVVWLFTHEQPPVFWNAWGTLSGVVFVSTLLVGMASVAHSWWTAHDYAERTEIRWVAFGVIVTSLGFLIAGTLASLGMLGTNPFVDFVFWQAPVLALPVSLAIAISRYHLWDLDIIIRRTLIYAVLTATLLVIYYVSVIVLQQVVSALSGQQHSEVVTVLSTLVIAAVFVPVRARVQSIIDQRFYRRRYDAAQIMAAFSESARDEVDLHRLQQHLLRAVVDSMEPASVSLWLKEPGRE